MVMHYEGCIYVKTHQIVQVGLGGWRAIATAIECSIGITSYFSKIVRRKIFDVCPTCGDKDSAINTKTDVTSDVRLVFEGTSQFPQLAGTPKRCTINNDSF